ncbi:MAG: ATP-binding cassette domain-containing protein, partial [Candidatus Marsarchaeota archaeon]|nr:ATP-binding cassette domain-containing protein [Candidatus Marsarchaeota archaeon]
MANIVEISSVVKKFGDFTAVDHVSISVKEGEIYGILGPNGAGKTTTINMLLGILPITSGVIHIAGLDIAKNPEKVKQLIGMMTQETVVETDLTARQNLEIFAALYHINEPLRSRRVAEALKEAELEKFADVKAGTFSG